MIDFRAIGEKQSFPLRFEKRRLRDGSDLAVFGTRLECDEILKLRSHIAANEQWAAP